MRYSLPLWCCLDAKSKLALRDVLEKKRETEIAEPQPVWREWRSDVIAIAWGEVDKGVDYDKFIRQAPSRSRD